MTFNTHSSMFNYTCNYSYCRFIIFKWIFLFYTFNTIFFYYDFIDLIKNSILILYFFYMKVECPEVRKNGKKKTYTYSPFISEWQTLCYAVVTAWGSRDEKPPLTANICLFSFLCHCFVFVSVAPHSTSLGFPFPLPRVFLMVSIFPLYPS